MDEIIVFGEAVKALGNGKVGGYLVRFSTSSDPDVTQLRDFFTPETDFDLERSTKATVMYDHGLDPVIKKRKLGTGEMKVDEVGIWIEAQLEMRDDYERAIYDMAQAGKLGWSSGSAPHLVERKKVGNANQIIRWPLGLDASLTPTPAEPRNAAVSLKSYAAERKAEGGAKSLYTQAVADRIPQLYQPVDTLTSVLSQLEWVAMSANGTDIEVDFAAEIDAVLADFQLEMREVALRRILAYNGAKSAELIDSDSQISNSYGKLSLSLPLNIHSKAVRDAARGLLERCSSLHATRQREGTKRTLNEAHTKILDEVASDLEQVVKASRDLTCDVKRTEAVRRARVDYQRTVAREYGVR